MRSLPIYNFEVMLRIAERDIPEDRQELIKTKFGIFREAILMTQKKGEDGLYARDIAYPATLDLLQALNANVHLHSRAKKSLGIWIEIFEKLHKKHRQLRINQIKQKQKPNSYMQQPIMAAAIFNKVI